MILHVPSRLRLSAYHLALSFFVFWGLSPSAFVWGEERDSGEQTLRATKSDNSANASSQTAAREQRIAFSLAKWKTLHFHDSTKAEQFLASATKLGCEVKQENHDGHIDVKYRCAEWKELMFTDANAADQWEQWLSSAGFDLSRTTVFAAFKEGAEEIEFRLVPWKTIHGQGPSEDQKMVEQLKQIGCEVRVIAHGNHNDIRYRAPTWRSIRVADSVQATQYATWLTARGFETSKGKKY